MMIAKTPKQERRAAYNALVEEGKRKALKVKQAKIRRNPNPKTSRKAKPLVLD